jgi:hypothetical protein
MQLNGTAMNNKPECGIQETSIKYFPASSLICSGVNLSVAHPLLMSQDQIFCSVSGGRVARNEAGICRSTPV